MSEYTYFVERIKQELSIDSLLPADTNGKSRIKCPLPDHDASSPSFAVHRETNSWFCWSHPGGTCGGSVIDYLMAERNLSFKEAVQVGADMLGIEMRPPTQEEKAEMERWRTREDVLTALSRVTHDWLMRDNDLASRAREYLSGRGFGEEFLKQQQLGLVNIGRLYAKRANHPILSDYPEQALDDVGLCKKSGGRRTQLFYGPRIAIPLIRRQRVVGYTFRALDAGQKAKYIHLPGAAGIYNEDALHKREVILTEGVPDCWTLMNWGFNAAGNLGVHAAKYADKFRGVEKLTLVWDNDDAGRANVLKSARAIQAEMPDGEIRILHLEAVNDVNDYANEGGTPEEFQALLDAAPTLIEYQIALLPDAATGGKMRKENRAMLDDTLRQIARLSESEQVPHLKELKDRINTSLPGLRRDMLAIVSADEEAELERARKASIKNAEEEQSKEAAPFKFSFKTVKPVVAALDFDLDGEIPKAHIGAWLRADAGEAVGEPIQCLVECQIEGGKPKANLTTYSKRQVDDPKLMRFPDKNPQKWSIDERDEYSVPRFVADPVRHSPDSASLFKEIRSLIKDYVWYPEEYDYDIVTVWIMMTYLYPLFGTVGFLHFHGMKAAGKSLSLSFVDGLAFNTRKGESVTEAVLFRTVHNNRATLILDEAEKFKNPRPGTPEANQRLILNGSYKEDATAMRMNMDLGQVECFSTFGPKCFGSIKEIDSVLGDRCIVIKCLKISEEDKGPFLDPAQMGAQKKARSQRLQNMLHCWALTKFEKVHTVFTQDLLGAVPSLYAREREIWMPLLTLAYIIDEENTGGNSSLFDLMIKTQQIKEKEKEEKNQRESPDNLILQTLYNLITGERRPSLEIFNHPYEYVTAKLASEIYDELTEAREWPSERKLTSSQLTNLLKTFNIVQEKHLRRRREGSKRVRTVYLREEDIGAALDRIQSSTAKKDGDELTSDDINTVKSESPAPQPAPQQASLPGGLDNDELPF